MDLNAFVFEDVWVIIMKGNVSQEKAVGVNVKSPTHLFGRAAVTEYLRLETLSRIFFAHIFWRIGPKTKISRE